MGQFCSCAKTAVQAIGKNLLSQLGLNFSLEEWTSAHNSGTEGENQDALNSLGTDLKKATSLPTSLKRAVFICCNTYTKPDYSLGVGPMNDAITVATYMKNAGFTIYFAHNPTSKEFLKFFKHFLSNTQDYLLVYYTGHGASVDDKHGDEADGKDEALVFDDAFVVDDELADAISTANKPEKCRAILLNDCCHSGSIYDLQAGNFNGRTMPGNIMSISAARDSETAKQTSIGGNDQGIFTFYFFKLLSETPSLTAAGMEEKITPYIKKYEQQYTVFSTSNTQLQEILFK